MHQDVTILPYLGRTPRIHESVFLAPGARVIGDVQIGQDSSVWYNVVIRGDVHWIRIGRETNVQDGSVLHVTGARSPLSIGDRVTIGHMAMLHGCTLEDLCLIGMNAIVLDDAVVGTRSLIGAGAVVTPRTRIPPGSLVLGNPGRVVRPLTDPEIEHLSRSAQVYVEDARLSRRSIESR